MIAYRREVDGLRAIAVVPVILFHAGIPGWSGGYVGVDVFFVVSGYLITSIILADLERGSFSIAAFYERRARRILPALFVVSACSFLIAWQLLLPDDMQQFCRSLVGVALFFSNVIFYLESGYFDTAGELKPMLHTWSLGVEEQFYLAYPLLMLLVWWASRRCLFTVMATVAAASFLTWVFLLRSDANAAFYLFPARAWELLLGGLVAMRPPQPESIDVAHRHRQTGAGLGLLLLAWIICFGELSQGLAVPLTVLATLLILMFADGATAVGRLLGTPMLVGIGLISYSAYLWHQPLLAFARHASDSKLSAPQSWGLIALTFALAFLSWRFVENPYRNPGAIDRRRVIFLGMAGAVFATSVGLAGDVSGGFMQRFETGVAGETGHAPFFRHLEEHYPPCTPESIARRALSWNGYLRCRQSRVGIPDLVLIGDSHAEHLFVGLAEQLPDANVAYYTMSDRPYVSDPGFRHIFAELLRNGRHQTVMLTMHYVTKVRDSLEFRREMSATVRALAAANKEVILVGDVPRYEKTPSACKYARRDPLCRLTPDQVELQRRQYAPVLEALAAENGIPYIDLHAPLCSDQACAMVVQGRVVYRARGHLNVAGSRLVGKHIHERWRAVANRETD